MLPSTIMSLPGVLPLFGQQMSRNCDHVGAVALTVSHQVVTVSVAGTGLLDEAMIGQDVLEIVDRPLQREEPDTGKAGHRQDGVPVLEGEEHAVGVGQALEALYGIFAEFRTPFILSQVRNSTKSPCRGRGSWMPVRVFSMKASVISAPSIRSINSSR